jgi:hypothetical protein
MSEFKSWEELSHKEQLECIFWDAYKDAHGFRPRHINVSAMTEAELEAELKILSTEIAVQEQERKEAEEKAAHDFEIRVQNLMMAGAKTRKQALRWIHEAEETQGDDEYLCYTLGLPYGYFKKVA